MKKNRRTIPPPRRIELDYSEKWGKDVEEAVRLALLDLKLARDEVKVTVLEEPVRGFLGIGAKLAKVRVEKKDEEDAPAPEKAAGAGYGATGAEKAVRADSVAAEAGSAVGAAADANAGPVAGDDGAPSKHKVRDLRKKKPAEGAAGAEKGTAGERRPDRPDRQRPGRREREPRRGERREPGRREDSRRGGERSGGDRFGSERPSGDRFGSERPSGGERGRGGSAEGRRRPSEEYDLPDYTEGMVSGDRPEGLVPVAEGNEAEMFFRELVTKMGLDLEIKAFENGECVYIEVSGKDSRTVIGKRGQTLDAIQYLTNLVMNKRQEKYIRVIVDVEGYRSRREKTLELLAAKLAKKVEKTGRNVKLEPMNPYERKVIHATLQSNSYVTTRSEGDEPYRRVIIEKK
ncbi:MAG: protein jag, partial [Clostridiales Family XIII bacterium]|jgi:spoIIIJ-associated protein|nr:protein jag [Clostridiales Family XIII bacterium]